MGEGGVAAGADDVLVGADDELVAGRYITSIDSREVLLSRLHVRYEEE